MLGTTILCITVMPVYDMLRNLLGVEGFLFSYADDVYMGGKPVQVAVTLTTTPCIYGDVGHSLSWGPKKKDRASPPNRLRP